MKYSPIAKSDTIKRISIIIVFWLFISYLVYLFLLERPIVRVEYLDYNIFLTIILILLCMYVTIFYGIYPIKVKFSRATLFVIGLATLLIAKMILENDPLRGIFIWDIAAILGVIILITGPTNLIVTKKTKKAVKEKDLEIIEV